jgi:hypothetical protein
MRVYDGTQRIPLVTKMLVAGIPILIVVIWFVYLQINGNKLERENFRNNINSVVIKSNSYYGRSEEFHLENGVMLYFRKGSFNHSYPIVPIISSCFSKSCKNI